MNSEQPNLTLQQAIAAFNQQEFYECHDILEAIWMDALNPEKTFYQGLLQIAVGLYHMHNLNWRGAVILLGEGISRLRHFQPTYMGIEVSQLISESAALLSSLQQSGSENIQDFVSKMETNRNELKLPEVRQVGE